MRPLTVITGIVLGSSFSITVSLAAVLLMFVVLGDKYPRLAHEFPALLSSLLVFSALTIVAALSFCLMLKEHAARWFGQAFLWTAILGAGYWFWP